MKKVCLLLCVSLLGFYNLTGVETSMSSCFLVPSDPLLKKQAVEVPEDEILSQQTQAIIDRMFEIAKGERTDTDKAVMVGLAAPQIGISKRIILVDIGVDSDRKELGQLTAYINPQILWKSTELEEGREGCYSVYKCLRGIVLRPKTIKIKAFDRQGNQVEQEFSGMTARIFQHEIDHLEGMCFPDQIEKQGKGTLQWVEDDEFSSYRENWREWPVKCSNELWEAMKTGKPYSPPDAQPG